VRSRLLPRRFAKCKAVKICAVIRSAYRKVRSPGKNCALVWLRDAATHDYSADGIRERVNE